MLVALLSLGLIALNALFVVVEFALVRVRPSSLELLVRRGRHRPAEIVLAMIQNLDEYLAAIQVYLATISLLLGWVGAPALADAMTRFLESRHLHLNPRFLHLFALALALGALSWTNIVLGELVPRTLGIQMAERAALWGAYPLMTAAWIARLPTAFMSSCSRLFLKPFGLKAADPESTVSEEELRVLIGETQERGGFPLERLLLLENLFDLGGAKVSEVMVPRDKVVYLSLAKSQDENLEIIRDRRFTRYPLCEKGLDSSLGLIHLKDVAMLPAAPGTIDWRSLLRPLSYVDETEPLEKLLKIFPDKGIHLALTRGADGRVSGLVTLEDLMEELVGEIKDEFDAADGSLLLEALANASVRLRVEVADRKSLYRELLEPLKAKMPGLNTAEAFRLLWERETKLSSAVGRGIAIPHARLPGLTRPLIAFARLAHPLSFQSPDGVPVRLVFLVLSPSGYPVVQLKLLSRIAALAMNENLRKRLLTARTPDAVIEILRTADTLLAS